MQQRKKASEYSKKTITDVKDFLSKATLFMKGNIGIVMTFCLFILFLFFVTVTSAVIFFPYAAPRLFSGITFVLVRIVIVVVVIYTGISALDYTVNFIMIKLPAEFVQSVRNDFMLKMNYMNIKANTNIVSSVFMRFFNVAAFSPSVINSPTMNFLIAFISMFGVLIVLVLKHVFLLMFNTIIKPFVRLFWNDKVEPRKEEVAFKIKSEYYKMEKYKENRMKEKNNKTENKDRK